MVAPAPKRYVHVIIPGTCQCDLIYLFIKKKDLCRCNWGRNLEMRSSWIIQAGPISNDKCPYEGTQGRDRRTKEGHVKTGRDRNYANLWFPSWQASIIHILKFPCLSPIVVTFSWIFKSRLLRFHFKQFPVFHLLFLFNMAVYDIFILNSY